MDRLNNTQIILLLQANDNLILSAESNKDLADLRYYGLIDKDNKITRDGYVLITDINMLITRKLNRKVNERK